MSISSTEEWKIFLSIPVQKIKKDLELLRKSITSGSVKIL